MCVLTHTIVPRSHASLAIQKCPSERILVSARQALNLLHPVGAALGQREDEQVRTLWREAAQAHTAPAPESICQASAQTKQALIERLYIELDGIPAQLHRGSVPLSLTLFGQRK